MYKYIYKTSCNYHSFEQAHQLTKILVFPVE